MHTHTYKKIPIVIGSQTINLAHNESMEIEQKVMFVSLTHYNW